MGNSHHIVLFLKFGEEGHINDLYENGTIYMNTVQSFREIEDNELRGDKYEGVSKIWNFPSGQFEIPQLNYKGNYLSMHLLENYERVLGNIYSLYCISSHGFESPDSFFINSKVSNFGSHVLMIKDCREFMNRLRNALKLLPYQFWEGFVEYYDKDKVNRSISIFEKPQEFEYQKEFRFYVLRKEILPLTFSIGSLRDIAEVYPSSVIFEMKLTSSK